MLAISIYDREETANWLADNEWSYPLLCNGKDVIAAYRLLNERQQRPDREGLPHPATIIIDKDGVVRFKNVWVDYRQRTPVETILTELDKIK